MKEARTLTVSALQNWMFSTVFLPLSRCLQYTCALFFSVCFSAFAFPFSLSLSLPTLSICLSPSLSIATPTPSLSLLCLSPLSPSSLSLSFCPSFSSFFLPLPLSVCLSVLHLRWRNSQDFFYRWEWEWRLTLVRAATHNTGVSPGRDEYFLSIPFVWSQSDEYTEEYSAPTDSKNIHWYSPACLHETKEDLLFPNSRFVLWIWNALEVKMFLTDVAHQIYFLWNVLSCQLSNLFLCPPNSHDCCPQTQQWSKVSQHALQQTHSPQTRTHHWAAETCVCCLSNERWKIWMFQSLHRSHGGVCTLPASHRRTFPRICYQICEILCGKTFEELHAETGYQTDLCKNRQKHSFSPHQEYGCQQNLGLWKVHVFYLWRNLWPIIRRSCTCELCQFYFWGGFLPDISPTPAANKELQWQSSNKHLSQERLFCLSWSPAAQSHIHLKWHSRQIFQLE